MLFTTPFHARFPDDPGSDGVRQREVRQGLEVEHENGAAEVRLLSLVAEASQPHAEAGRAVVREHHEIVSARSLDELLILRFITGLGLGSMYGLLALGFYITYSVSSTVNFAQGSSMSHSR